MSIKFIAAHSSNRIIGNKGTNYEFSTSNPLWRATLDVLDLAEKEQLPVVSFIVTFGGDTSM